MTFGEFFGALFGWFANFIEWIFDWVPRMTVIQWNERGVFYPSGRTPYEIGPDKRMPRWWRWLFCRNILPFGRRVHVLPPCWLRRMASIRGVHWFVPNLSQIETHHVSRMVLIIEALPLETGDEKPQECEVGGVLVYHITDVCAFEVENFDADESIATVAQGELQEIVTTGEWEKVKKSATNRLGDDSRVGKALVRAFQDRLGMFGIEIESFRFREQIRLGRGGAQHVFGIEFPGE